MAIHPTAIIDSKAELDSSVEVGPYCIIEGHVRVAAGCRLYQGVFLTGWTDIAENCELHPGVVVGHTPQDVKYHGERTFCRIGKGTILREYVTIHRGTIPESETVVGEGCFLLAGSHVGHNCLLGDKVTMINGALLAGHVTVGDQVTVGGGAMVHQFTRIGELVMIGGSAPVPMDVVPYSLINRDGRVSGLNSVGLRRSGMPREHIVELRQAFHALFGHGTPFRAGVARLAELVKFPPGLRLLEFLQAETKRGFAGRSRLDRTRS